MSSFLKHVTNAIPLSKETEAGLLQRIRSKIYNKGALIKEKPHKTYFIEEGLVRAFFYKIIDGEEREVTSWLVAENHFIPLHSSATDEEPLYEYLEALERTIVVEIPHEIFVGQESPSIEGLSFENYLHEYFLIQAQQRLRLLHEREAIRRLLIFEKFYPGLSNRVAQKYIASYLNIHPVTLSKLRGIRAKKES